MESPAKAKVQEGSQEEIHSGRYIFKPISFSSVSTGDF